MEPRTDNLIYSYCMKVDTLQWWKKYYDQWPQLKNVLLGFFTMKVSTMYSRVPNRRIVPNKRITGIFFCLSLWKKKLRLH